MDLRDDNDRLDAIAREAARLIETGRTSSLKDALHMAADALSYPPTHLPGASRVRKHAQAMAMQAMGEAAYLESKRAILRIAEEMMSALEQAFDDVEPMLVGRAAQGHTDAGVTLHIRLYTRRHLKEIAEVLVEYGYAEPTFDTVQTKYGPVNRLRFVENGVDIVLARCLPQLHIAHDADMFTGKRIEHATVSQVREMIRTGRP